MLEPPLQDHGMGGMATLDLSTPNSAPWFLVPSRPVVSVEHPFIVKDVAKAVESLGGSKAVGKVYAHADWNARCLLLTCCS
jgi:hypothetical protein